MSKVDGLGVSRLKAAVEKESTPLIFKESEPTSSGEFKEKRSLFYRDDFFAKATRANLAASLSPSRGKIKIMKNAPGKRLKRQSHSESK